MIIKYKKYCQKFKASLLFVLSAFLLLPSFLNLFPFSSPASAVEDSAGGSGNNNLKMIISNTVAPIIQDVVEIAPSKICNSNNKCEIIIDVWCIDGVCGLNVENSSSKTTVVDWQKQKLSQTLADRIMDNIGNPIFNLEIRDSRNATLLKQENINQATNASFTITNQGVTIDATTGDLQDRTEENAKNVSKEEIEATIEGNNQSDQERESNAQAAEQSTTGNGESEQTEATCSNSGGALSLGWIVCPIMQWAKDAANDIYKDYVEPSLRIEPQLFNTSNGNTANAHAAWSTFRDIANIVFVIFLLFVILSQVAGIGIDNYGIKKSLPKLIVAAILVNVSYYICMGAIDISNIIGNGIQSVFDGLSVGDPQAIEGVSNLAGEIGSTAISAVGIAVALFAAGAVIWKNPAIVLTFLVSLLGLIISIFFLFVLLVAREAMIIVLTVLSPLAFVCYMLPNTKNTYDKWFKALKALLFVYPVCSLLVAGGDWLSRLLLAAGYGNGGLIRAFTAMLVGILPIFFIPSVLKSSMSVMGNVGAKLSGLGKVARGYSTSKIRSSESFKNLQRKGLERKNEKASGWDPRTGQLTRIGKYKARIAGSKFGQATGYAKAQAAKIALAKKNTEQEKTAAAELLGVTAATDVAEYMTRTGNKREDYYGEQLERAGATGDLIKVEGVLQTMKSAGLKDKDIAAKLRGAIANNKIKFANDGSRMTWMTKMAAQEGNGYLATDFELTKYMQMGGDKSEAAALAKHGDWTTTYKHLAVDDVKREDITRLSGESLAGLAKSGLLTRSMAQQVMASNPNLSADRQIMLGAVAAGTATVTDAEDFSKEAKALASDPTGGTRKTSMITAVDGTHNPASVNNSVQAWTRPTPMAVNTIQDFSSGAYSGQAAPVETHDHVQDANVHGRDTSYRKYGQRGMYHQAPHGWVYDPSASAPGRPVFTNPDDPSRHYDAQANKYF